MVAAGRNKRSALRRAVAIVGAMPNDRRAFVPGGCWFFTVNLLDRDWAGDLSAEGSFGERV